MPAKKTKKITKTTVKKSTVKPEPAMDHTCLCGERCNCHCHGYAHWVKHVVAWAIIFALGMVCGKMICGCNHHGKYIPKLNPVFENGCLQMDSIECPKMTEKLMAADVNGDNCISMQEYKAVKVEMRKEMRKPHGPRAPYMDE